MSANHDRPLLFDLTRWSGLLGVNVFAGVGYFVLAQLGSWLQAPLQLISLIWPPVGFSIAVCLLWPVRRVVWGLALGQLVANVVAAHGVELVPLAPAITSAGSVLAAVCAALLIRRIDPGLCFDDLRLILRTGGVLLLSGLVSGATGTLALLVQGAIEPAVAPFVYVVWALGDGFGALIVFPPVMALLGAPSGWGGRRLRVVVPMLVMLALISQVTRFLHDSNGREIERMFAAGSSVQLGRLAALVEARSAALQTLTAFVEAGVPLDRATIRRVASNAMRADPALLGMRWNARVAAADRPAFEARMRAAPGTEFRIVDAAGAPVAPAVDVVVETWSDDSGSVGHALDIGSDPQVAAALRLAERSRAPAISAHPRRQGADGVEAGLEMFLPAFADDGRLLGFASALLDAGALFEVLRADPALDWVVTDRAGGELRASQGTVPAIPFEGASALIGDRVFYQQEIAIGGAVWHAVLSKNWKAIAYAEPSLQIQSTLAFLLADCFGTLLAGFLLMVTGQARRTEAVVVTRTRELQEARDRAQRYLDVVDVIIVAVNREGRVSLINQAGLRLLGLASEEEVRGQPWYERFIPPSANDAPARAAFAAMLRGERAVPREIESELLTAHGERRLIAWRNHELRDADGALTNVLGAGINITELRQAQRQLAAQHKRLEALVQASAQIVVEFDAAGGMNGDVSTWCAFTGQAPGAALGTGYLAMVHPDDAAASTGARRESAATLRPVAFEWRLRMRNGSWRWHQVRSVPIAGPGSGFDCALAMMSDIHDRRSAEEDLRVAKQLAESANHVKSRFLAVMSHEIRTPLNGMLGMAQLLLQPERTPEELRQCGRTIFESGEVLLTILNDILDFSKMEEGKLQLSAVEFDPRALLDDVGALFRPLAQAKGLAFDSRWRGPADACYGADSTRLRQMVANLLSNAIKFTPGGFIDLEACEIERGDDGSALLEFAVSDSGIGIEPELQPLLFERFGQIDVGSARRAGGTGLGLSIVRGLAEQMGGSVGVESRAGEGARFWFRVRVQAVPAATEQAASAPVDTLPPADRTDAASVAAAESPHAAPAAAMPAPQPAASTASRVLVVDDNLINRNVVELALKARQFGHGSAVDGREAVDLVTGGERFAAIIMDCQMPVMDGWAATRAIRAWEADTGQPRTPIIALTAGAFESDRAECFAAGMDDFLAKPLRIDEFYAVLAKWCGDPA